MALLVGASRFGYSGLVLRRIQRLFPNKPQKSFWRVNSESARLSRGRRQKTCALDRCVDFGGKEIGTI
jgi:hypothetical protein